MVLSTWWPLVVLIALPAAGRCAEDEDGARLSAPRVLLTASHIGGGKVLIVGGLKDSHSLLSAMGTADLLDCGGTECALTTMPLGGDAFAARAGHAADLLPGGRLLVAGGNLKGSVELFEPAEDGDGPGAFRWIGLLPGGARMELTATTLLDGRVLIVGGLTGSGKSSSRSDLYDPVKEQILKGPDLSEPRHGHTATLLKDGRVLIAGGVGRSSTELFDPIRDRFLPGPEMAHARDDHAATRLEDGTVLITGGQLASGRSVASTARFDPASNRFLSSTPMNFDRADHVQIVLPDGSVLVMGGESDDGKGHDTILDSVERFDPATGRFERTAPLKFRRDDHAAVLLPDGRILVAGGQGPGDRPLQSVEFYRPERSAESKGDG
ncbi:MAG: kelch repeat-containing protein [Planctomycetota bacterium]